jgi:hypothetical protein
MGSIKSDALTPLISPSPGQERGKKKKERLAPLLDALQGGSSDVTRTEPFWVNPAS